MATEVVALDGLEERPAARPFGDSDPEVVRLALGEGESVPPHTHPGRGVVVFVVSGRLDARIDGESHELTAGEMVRFEGHREVSPAAIEDTVALVILGAAERGAGTA